MTYTKWAKVRCPVKRCKRHYVAPLDMFGRPAFDCGQHTKRQPEPEEKQPTEKEPTE